MNSKKPFRKHTLTQTIQANREGWIGAWDAIVAAVTKRPRLSVAREITISIYATETVEITCIQAETGEKPL